MPPAEIAMAGYVADELGSRSVFTEGVGEFVAVELIAEVREGVMVGVGSGDMVAAGPGSEVDVAGACVSLQAVRKKTVIRIVITPIWVFNSTSFDRVEALNPVIKVILHPQSYDAV